MSKEPYHMGLAVPAVEHPRPETPRPHSFTPIMGAEVCTRCHLTRWPTSTPGEWTVDHGARKKSEKSRTRDMGQCPGHSEQGRKLLKSLS